MSESVRTFRASTVLLFLGSPLYDFSEAGFQIAENPVSVLSEDGRVIGHAVIEKTEAEIRATLILHYATPERFEIEVGALKLYARANGDGYLYSHRSFFDIYTQVITKPSVARVFIENITLTTTPPADERIQPLQWEQKE